MNHFKKSSVILLLLGAMCGVRDVNAAESAEGKTVFPGQLQNFHGFEQYRFELEGQWCKVVLPKQVADGKPWVWRAQFWGHEPQLDVALLKQGYHVAHIELGNALGSPDAMKQWDAFYEYLRFEHLFADRAVLEGMSRGGLYVYNWAARNPDKVACVYADNPVCDFKSWPGGKGGGKESPKDWGSCLKLYGLTEEEALAYTGNPVDNLAPLAKEGIPLIHVVGTADTVVPVAENTDLIEKRYKALGGHIEVIRKPGLGHHPHSLKDPKPLVDFILQKNRGKGELSAEEIVSEKNFILHGDYRKNFRNFRVGPRYTAVLQRVRCDLMVLRCFEWIESCRSIFLDGITG